MSNEFRALVTLIRGPLEEELADRAALPPVRRERIRALHRNFMRLLELVNTLFDMSGIDGSRRTSPALVDLAARTVVIPMLRANGEPVDPAEPTRPHAREDDTPTAELERTIKELEAFSYSVSHDLRGPLRAVDGFSQILLGNHAHALDRDGLELVAQIHANARRMSAIVDDLLALSRAGKGELRHDRVDLSALARRVVADLRLREPRRIVEVSIAEGLAARGDGHLLAIALENLFANAWKFTSTRPNAQIIFRREPGEIFALHDNGVGFDMAYAEHLFEPFQRLHSASDFEGTGIGLAIVRRVVERHGGQVWANAVVNGGATLRFTLHPSTS